MDLIFVQVPIVQQAVREVVLSCFNQLREMCVCVTERKTNREIYTYIYMYIEYKSSIPVVCYQ